MKVGNLEVYGVIYKITNKVNGKVYIGQTTRANGFNGRYPYKGEGIERVKLYHEKKKEEGVSYNEYLLNSINKYGCDKFEVCEVFDFAFTQEELNIKEEIYIKLYKSTNKKYGYNFTYGGEGGKHTKESKCKLGRKVICINDGKEFMSLLEASEYYNIPTAYIRKTMNKKFYSDKRHFKYLRFLEPERELKDNEKYCCCCGRIMKLKKVKKRNLSKNVVVYNKSKKYCGWCDDKDYREYKSQQEPNMSLGITKFYEYKR